MTEPWLSAGDFASQLGTIKDQVYTWIAENGMPAHKNWPSLEFSFERDRQLGKAWRGGPHDSGPGCRVAT